MGVARVHGHVAHLHAHLLLAQVGHVVGIGQQALLRLVFVLARLYGLFVLFALAHKALHQRVLGRPLAARAPQAIGRYLQLAALARHGLVGPGLHARINGRLHHQAVGVDVVVVRVGPVDQPFAQLLCKVRRHANGFVLALKIQLDGALLQRLKVFVAELVVLVHLRQHGVAARLGALRVVDRVVVAGAFEHAHQGGGLDHVQLAGGFVKVGARRHLNAKGVVEEGHGVEIRLQNLVLGVGRFNLVRGDCLFELAVERAGAPDFLGEQIARQLLGNGRSALGLAHQGVDHRAARAAPVHAAVLVKTVVFGRDQRIDDIGRNVFQRHPLAVRALVLRQHLAVGRHQLRRRLDLGFLDVVDRRSERNQDQHIQQQQDRQRQHGQQPLFFATPRQPRR